MAESISEGTLKQWVKKVGDSVEADEEVATIETDKVRHFPWSTILGFVGLHLYPLHIQTLYFEIIGTVLTYHNFVD